MTTYTYDAWGNILSITGTLASTIGANNPIRYRGYYYDAETGLYYLQSRYYSPEWGRFLNADAVEYLGYSGTVLSCNLFLYCVNSPVQILDPNGYMSFQLGRYAVYFTIPNDDYSYNIYSPTIKDYTSFYFSKTAGNAAKIKYPDGGVFYLHFLENKGENYCYDYSKAIREDSAIDKAVTSYINQLLKAARKLVPKDGKKYYITANSTKLDVIVPSSNNWRLAIGSHQIGFKVECYYDKNNKSYKMYTTLIAYDRYNFDKDTVFVYKNIKINVAWNGRLVEVGLAKFYTSVGIYQFYSIF